MQNLVFKFGRFNSVVVATSFATFSSLIITVLIFEIFGGGLNWLALVSATLAPLLTASFASWYIFGFMLKIQKLEKKQRTYATYDQLTGLVNRRVFLEKCNALIKLILRRKSYFSFAYIDIDDFKKVNDTYGHATGDAVLKSFSAALISALRESDLTGRLGGEEFGVALPETDMKGALHILEKVRAKIEGDRVEYDQQTLRYTISIGVAQWDGKPPIDLDELIRNADEALYRAKAAGKNQVIQYQA